MQAAPAAAGPSQTEQPPVLPAVYPDDNATETTKVDGADEDDSIDETLLCINCGVTPAFETYKYCSRKCDAEAKGSKSSLRALIPTRKRNLCVTCQKYPKIPGFEFCSNLCKNSVSLPLNPGIPGSRFRVILPTIPVPPGNPCQIPNCQHSEVWKGAKYCSNKCRKEAVTSGLEHACYLCKTYPKMPGKHFCGKKCSRSAETQAPLLLEVPTTDPKYTDVVNQFNATWGGTPVTIERVCKVVNTKAVETRYQEYRQSVEKSCGFKAQGKTAGNELRRWHGTGRGCTIGDSSKNMKPCSGSGCALCSIFKSSFNMSFARGGTYGSGIYTSAYSWKSNGYTHTKSGSQTRAMFLTRVVAGNVRLSGVGGTLKGAMMGSHSLASDAKHTELIVHENKAICPSWLVIYK